jgi:uncharacterized repeat protein (TIGR01451 family)
MMKVWLNLIITPLYERKEHRAMKSMMIVMLFSAMILLVNGCCEPQATKEVVYVPPPEPEPTPCAAPRMVSVAQGYPAVGPEGGAISMEKLVPNQVVVNEPFDFRIKVTNLTDSKLLNVVVTGVKPAHMKLLTSDPEIHMEENQVQWRLGALGPNASTTITVRATALETETIFTCANVTYDIPTCAQIEIVEPKLLLTKEAPEVSLRCDRIPIRYTITNTGSGHACDIDIIDQFSKGLVTSEGLQQASFSIESLGPDETKEFTIMVDAIKPGIFASRATASARSGGKAASEMIQTVTTEPVLTIEHSGPANRYIGKPATFDIIVTNRGDAAAKDSILEVMVPDNVRFDGATDGGVFTKSSPGKVTWNLGMLNPKESRKVSLTVIGLDARKVMTQSSVKAYCAETVTDSAQTVFAGIPAVLLEVVDLTDPVEIGEVTTYVITVTNQGSLSSSNIQVKCTLEEGMEYVSSSGSSKVSATDHTITFEPLASLEPKAKAKWLVNVKATGTGDKRFKAEMITEQLERIVLETEATRFFE